MEFMFNQCKKLKEIKGINIFNTINVTNMCSMFNECSELEYLDLSNFNTSKVENIELMFNKCNKLIEIKGIQNFKTNNVTNMGFMFNECTELKYLDLSNFYTVKVTNMEHMFSKCHKLKEIKGINYFNISNLINTFGIFEECNELTNYEELIFLYSEIYEQYCKRLKNWNIAKKEITVNFISIDQNIKYSITCFNSDIFSTILVKLFDKFPELKERNIYFIVNGNIINKLSSLESNKIRNGNQILINFVN